MEGKEVSMLRMKIDSEAAKHRMDGRKEQKDTPETRKLNTEGRQGS